ncbi:MAG: class I SAM-dependent methyltransferase [Peptococcaceae bacterium]|nr:class I SAM-dependent methyltransferase [Peptococcaceae bacterium]
MKTIQNPEVDHQPSNEPQKHEVFDYNHVDYNKFWQEHNRTYEDRVERIALQRLTKDMQGTCIEIGGGFGRLINEYAPKCSYVYFTDCTEKLVAQAKQHIDALGLTNVECQTLNLYDLSKCGQVFDNAICVRVMHHVEDVPFFFQQVNAVLPEDGTFIFEYANKKNFLEICRYLCQRPNIAPFAYEPSRRGNGIFYNFHPKYIRDMLRQNGFMIEEELAVSLFRNGCLKKLFGYRFLSWLERFLQKPLACLHPSPSIFIKAKKVQACSKPAPPRKYFHKKH